MIAMALCCQPRLLIADEPTTALDVTIQAQILQLLKQLNENEQMNIILITHDLGVVASLANPPAGCPFVTRCRFACEECKKGIPSMRAYSDTQSSRCIFTKEELDEKEKKEEEK